MIDAERIALLREEFGYHADVAFATAETGTYCRKNPNDGRALKRPVTPPESSAESSATRYVLS